MTTSNSKRHLGIASAVRNVPLAQYSNWGIGGPADYFVEPSTLAEVRSTIDVCQKTETQYIVIGNGTNLLFDDSGYRGLVLRLGPKLANIRFTGPGLIEAECGSWVPYLALRVARAGYSGLQHAVGIPARLGGLIYMNGGSLRKSISENILSVTILEENGAFETLDKPDCEFGYRRSRFQNDNSIVLSAVLCFPQRACYIDMRREMLQILRSRRLKFPRKAASCGSTFVSSTALHQTYGPPGKIIEELGFKGYRRGKIEVSQQHANFLLNLGGGSSRDVLAIVNDIKSAVTRHTYIDLVCEFRYVHPTTGIQSVGSEL